MRSILDAGARASLGQRLRRLTPETPRRWGAMTSAQVLAHLHDSLLIALGRIPVVVRRSPLRCPPLKQLFLYIVPIPKGVPTSPELLGRAAVDFDAEVRAIAALLEECADPAQSLAPEHPVFGRMSRRDWGTLVYRHMDHHLRQFGA